MKRFIFFNNIFRDVRETLIPNLKKKRQTWSPRSISNLGPVINSCHISTVQAQQRSTICFSIKLIWQLADKYNFIGLKSENNLIFYSSFAWAQVHNILNKSLGPLYWTGWLIAAALSDITIVWQDQRHFAPTDRRWACGCWLQCNISAWIKALSRWRSLFDPTPQSFSC